MADPKAKKPTKTTAAKSAEDADKKAPKEAAKAVPAAPAPAAAAGAPDAAPAPAVRKRTAPPAADFSRGKCTIDGCKQPLRAKGLCRKHYMGWRRGKIGKKHRYDTCSKEGCRNRVVRSGRCQEHQPGAKSAGGEAAAAG